MPLAVAAGDDSSCFASCMLRWLYSSAFMQTVVLRLLLLLLIVVCRGCAAAVVAGAAG
jgi:hypothetical protein